MLFGKQFVKDAYAEFCYAALDVAEKARAEGRELPFSVDGKVVHQIPTLDADQVEKLIADCDRRLEASGSEPDSNST